MVHTGVSGPQTSKSLNFCVGHACGKMIRFLDEKWLGIRCSNWDGTSYPNLPRCKYSKNQDLACFPYYKKTPKSKRNAMKNPYHHQNKKPTLQGEEVGGLCHHVRDFGMKPRRYILGSLPILDIKLTSHKNENRDITTFTMGIMGGGRVQSLGQHSPYIHAYIQNQTRV